LRDDCGRPLTEVGQGPRSGYRGEPRGRGLAYLIDPGEQASVASIYAGTETLPSAEIPILDCPARNLHRGQVP
jgi:hypothetical protein